MTRMAWCIRTVCIRAPTDWPKDASERKRVRIDATCCQMAEDPKTVWEPTEIANWYGGEGRTVEIASQTAVWYSTGLPAVPVRSGC
jgi:hypothetical protein